MTNILEYRRVNVAYRRVRPLASARILSVPSPSSVRGDDSLTSTSLRRQALRAKRTPAHGQTDFHLHEAGALLA